ncbi:hypothetical protein P6144_01640 [Sphingomonas sp. HITSZ_GF]|uniref:hypothetical protein n=1 Tax=Sphingomonas sp. HITSZ_GF TaxID=3037247 RepID=UPI00240D0C17|nr:hypothetical protein [Sphingomonas sp. HITSZ_GF]MDG2532335.1 hypothetical protein [Sphingomonas sp. HITSZ_GF]
MAFVAFTRPDGEPVSVNTAEIFKVTPVPTSGATMGPLTEGTRIYFKNGTHQDVKELVDVVHARLNGG